MINSGKYKVHVSPEADARLLTHATFLAQFSIVASDRLIDSFDKHIDLIEEHPMMYQIADELDAPGIPPKLYRRCVFEEYYKIFFRIDGENIFVEAVLDARAENKDIIWNGLDQDHGPAGG